MSAETRSRSAQRARAARLTLSARHPLVWLLPGLGLHIVGLALFVNWSDVIANPPLHYTDYATHYAATEAASAFLRAGQLWGYSPYFHAGYAAGAIFDIDNKAVEVASYGLQQLRLSLPHAYSVVMLSLMAIGPLVVFAAARQVGLGPPAAGLAQLLFLAAWYGDRAVRWMWQGSILSFAAAALGSLWAGAAYWGWARAPRGARSRPAALAAWFTLGPLLPWVHAEACVVLAVLMAAGLLAYARRWPAGAWAALLAWSAWVILINWPWLGTALRHLSTITGSSELQGGLGQLRADLLAWPGLWRAALLALAAAGLWRWRLTQAVHWPVLGLSLAVFLALAYGGSAIGLGLLQPYRLILPALALAALPAADWLVGQWSLAPARGGLALLAVGLAAAPALYLGRPRDLRLADGTPSNHLGGPQPAEHAVCAALAQLDLSLGRVLTNDFRLGAWLPTCSGAQVIGGPFYAVWTRDDYANASWESLFGQPVGSLSGDALSQLLERYNVQWVVVNDGFPGRYTLQTWAGDHPGLLQPLARHGAFSVFAVSAPGSWFAQGSGMVRAEYNRLEVRGASPGAVVLKYHWLPSLRADPALPVSAVYLGGDPVPFIRVANGGAADFDLIQTYD